MPELDALREREVDAIARRLWEVERAAVGLADMPSTLRGPWREGPYLAMAREVLKLLPLSQWKQDVVDTGLADEYQRGLRDGRSGK